MRPVVVTAAAVAASNPVVVDIYASRSVSVGVVVTGTITYTVQHTFDDPFASGGLASATWFSCPDAALVGATANQDYEYTMPVRAIRVNNTAGTGSTSMTVIQAGMLS